MKGLADKRVLVTGSSYGIGRAVAVRFAAEGGHIAINHRDSAGEAAITESLVREAQPDKSRKVTIVQADVSRDEQVERLMRTVIEELGGLDVLVNNSGIQVPAPSHEASLEDFDRVMGVNLRGAFMCARAAIRHFLERDGDGVILNMSSVHEIIPKPGYIGYSVSKGGLQNLTRTLALEYADAGIRVNGIGPGATITPINRSWIHDPEKRAAIERRIPMRRSCEPEEVAALCAFLASEEATYIIGQTIFIDGGLTIFGEFKENWTT